MPVDQLRILEIFQPPDGGVAEHVRALADGLHERGQHVTVAGPADATARAPLERTGVPYRTLPIVGDMIAPRADATTVRAIAGLLGAGDFDVLHAHGQKAGLLGRACALRAGVPPVYTPHSFVYRSQLHRPRRSARARYRASLAAERFLGRRSAAITACAEDEARIAVSDRIAPPALTCVVNSGVALPSEAEPDPALVRHRGDGPLIGMVAGLREQKGVPTLIDALELLAARRVSPRFAIVGNGELWSYTRERLDRSGLSDSTLLLPFTSPVERYLSALDAFVLPSYWEGLPIAVLEAMAAGLPVVATAVDGTPEAVEDGATGYLVPAEDPRALADAIARVAADSPERRAEMGRRGRAVVEDRFSIPRMVDEMLGVYRSIVAGVPLPATDAA